MLRVRSLGRVAYEEAFSLQRSLAEHSTDDYLLALEHPSVFTLGVRADPAHVLVDPASVGARLVRTNRGGDVTYHGPGQLVVYPILTVASTPGAGREHVFALEQVVIDALCELGVAEHCGGVGRVGGFPGVFLGTDGPAPRKVAAVGVRVVRTLDSRRRTLHGVALNVDCDLSMFERIVPCGISGLRVTSLAQEGLALDLASVEEAVVARGVAAWSRGTVEHQGVEGGRSRPPAPTGVVVERPLLRRLRQAGVDPDDGLPMASRKPEWLRAPVRIGTEALSLGRTIRELGLVTVCQEAGCPNLSECWTDGTATFMVNGSRCTRACGFCLVDTRHPLPLDESEPQRVARAVEAMGLAHAVITCVARDDLADGGAGAIAVTVEAIRQTRPSTVVETLISDCKGDEAALAKILAVRPDVLNHNVETVARLQRAVRPSAGYARSLAVLARAAAAGLVTKSGLMVGLGETRAEVIATLADLAGVGVRIATIGQYLRPSRDHLPVARYWSPDEFESLRGAGLALGLAHVEAGPLVRSSYHARQAADAVPVALGPRVRRAV
jgi:lipoic acid synthetase